LDCKICGYGALDVHKTHDTLVTYCQQCGTDTKEKIDNRPDRWSDDQKNFRVIQGEGKTSAISHMIPLPSKKKKKRRG
jgi:hypothetical protein